MKINRRRRRIATWAGRLTAVGLGMIALAAGGNPPARAAGGSEGGAKSGLPRTDQLKRTPLLFSADDLNYDAKLHVVLARGNVEISQNGRTLFADVISYNENANTVVASGHVMLVESSGDTVFGSYVELTDDLRDGFIKDIRVLMADRSRAAANYGRRIDGNWTELSRGVYSPCDICIKDPTKPPSWQLKAERIDHNQSDKTITYHDAWLQIHGVPVFYTPYLSTPDPTVKRRSGFLAPTIESSGQLGLHSSIPYYWDIAPDKDLLFSPIISDKTGLVLAGRYRQRFGNGAISTFMSATDAFDGYGVPGAPTGRNQIRGNIATKGLFDLDDQFRAGFDINRATDQTYTRIYNLDTWNSFLVSKAFLEDFAGRDYGNVTAYSFQALRQGITDRTQAFVLPRATYTWYGRPLAWGGQFTSTADVLDVVRESGPSAQRLSLGTDYEQPWTAPDGEVFKAIAAVRGDSYYVSKVPQPGGSTFTGGTGRVYPQLGLEWRYPFARIDRGSSWIIEPHAAVYAAPPGGNSSQIVNNDSQAFNYSDADLFVPDRLYGYDEVDSGQRVDYAMRLAWAGRNGPHGEGLFGQSYRFQSSTPFQPGTGLDSRRSDYVGRVTFSPNQLLDLGYHFRLARSNFNVRNQQFSATFGPRALRVTLTYISLSSDPRDAQSALRQVGGSFLYQFTDFWSVSMSTVRNLGHDTVSTGIVPGITPYYAIYNNNAPLTTTGYNSSLANRIAISYTDECMSFIMSFVQSGTRDRDIKPDNAILFQLVFKNLGGIDLPSGHL
jgi:LPS-assembly protein